MKKEEIRAFKEIYWNKALTKSKEAINKKSLIPLETSIYKIYNDKNYHFELRKLTSKKPPHLINTEKQPNKKGVTNINKTLLCKKKLII